MHPSMYERLLNRFFFAPDREGDPDPQEETMEDPGEQEDDEDPGEQDDGDETIEEDDDDDAGEQQTQPGGQPSRSSRRMQSLRTRAQEAERNYNSERAQREQMQRELDNLRQSLNQNNATAQQIAEQERLAQMDPMERMAYQFDVNQRQQAAALRQTQIAMADQLDRQAFILKAQSNPLYAKHADEVERVTQEYRRQGQTTDRETILAFVIGKGIRDKASGAMSRESAKGKTKISASRSKPTSGRSDTGRTAPTKDGDDLASIEARLKGKFI